MATTQNRIPPEIATPNALLKKDPPHQGNGTHVFDSAERTVAASLIAEWPERPSGALKRIIDGAPDSFFDPRLGELVYLAKVYAHDMGSVEPDALKHQNPRFSELIFQLSPHAVSHVLAELEAKTVLSAWQTRKLQSELQSLRKDLDIQPEATLAGISTRFLKLSKDFEDSPQSSTGIKTGFFEQFADYLLPQNQEILGNYLCGGSVTMLVGQGGLGKSRLALCLAVAQITGKPWCDIPTSLPPKRWLMLGVENSIRRIRSDTRNIRSRCSPSEIALLNNHLRIQLVESIDDGVPDDFARITAEVQNLASDVVVIDPISDWINVSDQNSAAEMRQATRLLIHAIHKANPLAAILLLHHARTGRQNILQATGFDAANFASGSKALHAIVRCQLNLAPADPDDSNKLVLHCAKSNDAEPFHTRGILYDHSSCNYAIDPDFNLQTWEDRVEGKISGQSAGIGDVVRAVRSGLRSSSEIVNHLVSSTLCSPKTAKRRLSDALDKGYLQKLDGLRGQFILGPKASSVAV